MTLETGTRLGPYEILAPAGAGGMGEVYRGRDTRLDRIVAIKVLPADLLDDEEHRRRFEQEARAVSQLNHPHVCTLYDIGCENGVDFLVLEYLEGETLAARLQRGPISLDEILVLGRQITDALGAAHRRGIVHRDLKPANIMLTSAGPKLLDFGLAKIQKTAAVESLDSDVMTEARTQRGAIVGTAPYMSPEQIQGGGVDARSDVFSFGVLLYEMISGKRPFNGDKPITLLSSILKDDPPPVADVSEKVRIVLDGCLAKDPRERYQSGEELCRALSDTPQQSSPVSSPPVSSDAPWIVVRQVKSRGSDEELSTFAEELTEDIIAGLALFTHLSVISDSTASGGNVRFGIEGTLRRSGANIRVNIKLLDLSTGAHLWAEQFDRQLATDDVFAVQDALTDRIVATIADASGVLTRSLVTLARAKPESELTALDCVLRAFGYSWQWRREEHAALRTVLERAVEREPNHVAAWACLCETYLDEHRYYYNPMPDSLDRALGAARRAVELDATSQLAHRALMETQYFRRELGAFRSAAERTLLLNPRDTLSVALAGMYLCHGGDWERGRSVIDKAMAMNPHHAGWLHFLVAWDHYRKREYVQALTAAEKVNMPGYPGSEIHLAAIHAQAGNTRAAERHLAALLDLSPRYGKIARVDLSKWFVEETMVEHIIEGLQKAGLDVEDR